MNTEKWVGEKLPSDFKPTTKNYVERFLNDGFHAAPPCGSDAEKQISLCYAMAVNSAAFCAYQAANGSHDHRVRINNGAADVRAAMLDYPELFTFKVQ